MTVKSILTEDFYGTLKLWWEEHKFPTLDISFLPEQFFVCYNGHVATHAMCVYQTDSGLCWTAFPTSNPLISHETKQGGLDVLMEGVTRYAKEEGYKYIFTTSPVKRVQEALVASGFNLGDENVNHYIKII